jgi:hypothetical protein
MSQALAPAILLRPFNKIHTPPQRKSTHRIVRGLLSAWESLDPGMPKARYWGRKAEGIRFEKAVSELLPSNARRGVWFRYEDSAGLGVCQPDWIVPLGKKTILIVECKRTECPEGTTQLTRLYFPVVERATGRRPIGMLVCNYLTLATPTERIFGDFTDALASAHSGNIPILHWMR